MAATAVTAHCLVTRGKAREKVLKSPVAFSLQWGFVRLNKSSELSSIDSLVVQANASGSAVPVPEKSPPAPRVPVPAPATRPLRWVVYEFLEVLLNFLLILLELITLALHFAYFEPILKLLVNTF